MSDEKGKVKKFNKLKEVNKKEFAENENGICDNEKKPAECEPQTNSFNADKKLRANYRVYSRLLYLIALASFLYAAALLNFHALLIPNAARSFASVYVTAKLCVSFVAVALNVWLAAYKQTKACIVASAIISFLFIAVFVVDFIYFFIPALKKCENPALCANAIAFVLYLLFWNIYAFTLVRHLKLINE